jgi:hypothetical protein
VSHRFGAKNNFISFVRDNFAIFCNLGCMQQLNFLIRSVNQGN